MFVPHKAGGSDACVRITLRRMDDSLSAQERPATVEGAPSKLSVSQPATSRPSGGGISMVMLRSLEMSIFLKCKSSLSDFSFFLFLISL